MGAKHWISVVFDTVFVLVLCIFTLLGAMIISGNMPESEFTGYVINPFFLAAVVISIAAFLGYLLTQSIKMNRKAIDEHFAMRAAESEE